MSFITSKNLTSTFGNGTFTFGYDPTSKEISLVFQNKENGRKGTIYIKGEDGKVIAGKLAGKDKLKTLGANSDAITAFEKWDISKITVSKIQKFLKIGK